MHYLTITTHFSSAHQLRNYNGNCSNLHGHNWKVKLTFGVNKLNEIGIGCDFKVLKKIVNDKIDILDHTYLNDLDYFQQKNPTAENISEYIFNEVSKIVPDNIFLYEVEVFESDKYSVIYRKDS